MRCTIDNLAPLPTVRLSLSQTFISKPFEGMAPKCKQESLTHSRRAVSGAEVRDEDTSKWGGVEYSAHS